MTEVKVLDLDVETDFIFKDGVMIQEPENPRTINWPVFDPDPRNCDGAGQTTCLREGRHSWWNHSQDSFYKGSLADNYPPGFDRSIDA